MTNTASDIMTTEIREVRQLTESTAVLRFDRNDLTFKPGQYLSVGLGDPDPMREYSIYSGPDDDCLEILVKAVDGGKLSPNLTSASPGDGLRVEGPFGHFTIAKRDMGRSFLFVASGTGIAPFRCLSLAYSELDFRLVHGVSYAREQYERAIYGARYVGCVSREPGGDFHGRVTDYLADQTVDPNTLCYVCGNCNMIYDVFDILGSKGISTDNLRAEVYF